MIFAQDLIKILYFHLLCVSSVSTSSKKYLFTYMRMFIQSMWSNDFVFYMETNWRKYM